MAAGVVAPGATLSPTAWRVQDALEAARLDCMVVEHATPARTSAEAVAQIAKSPLFRAGDAGALLVVASGANRVDEAKLSAAAGTTIGKVDADFVRSVTACASGGIPPLAHAQALPAYIHRNLRRRAVVCAAGSTPNAMFPIRPSDLVRVSDGIIVDVALFTP